MPRIWQLKMLFEESNRILKKLFFFPSQEFYRKLHNLDSTKSHAMKKKLYRLPAYT